MNVILDTSVWIEYLRGEIKYYDKCQKLMESGQVLTVEIIFGELLQGAANKREIEVITELYSLIKKVKIDNLYILAGDMSFREKFISKGIGLIDASIIMATIMTNSQVWTLDKKIKNFIPKKYLYS